MFVLVTGGAGFIGTHTIVALLAARHEVVVIDNNSNSSTVALSRVEQITGKKVPCYHVDLRDRIALEKVMQSYHFDCCIHFAGLKAVGESIAKPWLYYDNNINGSLVLLDLLQKYNCKNIVFSSSATVYGYVTEMPVTEEFPTGSCTNPYGQTKFMLEQILSDLHTADLKNHATDPWNIVLLRYFNPIGAHPSGLIGENPYGVPNNLMPYITQVAAGKLDKLHIYGNDYDTPDGTCIRDYIHVVDLARGHVNALKAIDANCGLAVYNLGTGKGYSVLELVKAFERVNGIAIPFVIDPCRPGDVPVVYSDSSKAERELGWKAEYGLDDMVRDAWNWQKNNPKGYE